MLFTTSWDDGYALDLRVSNMLTRHGLTGTFYVCPTDQHEENLLTKEQLKTLSSLHEIGAHTMHHPHLTQLSDEQVLQEMTDSKRWVEESTGNPCTMFCYPYGDCDERIVQLAKKSGFTGARTTQDLQNGLSDPFLMPTTLQVMPFPWRKRFTRLKHFIDPLGPLRARVGGLRKLSVPLSSCGSWLSLARALFEKAVHEQWPWFHLWGHSHELERYDMWNDLDLFLQDVARAQVKAVPNSKLISE